MTLPSNKNFLSQGILNFMISHGIYSLGKRVGFLLLFLCMASACRTSSQDEASGVLSESKTGEQKALVNYNGSIHCASSQYVLIQRLEELPSLIKRAAQYKQT